MTRYRIAGRPVEIESAAPPPQVGAGKEGEPRLPAVAAPINAATLRVAGQTTALADEPRNHERGVALAAPTDLQRKYADWASRQTPRNELLAFARGWDLWGGAALLVLLVWLAVSSVFSLA